jgi:hypothetical protein
MPLAAAELALAQLPVVEQRHPPIPDAAYGRTLPVRPDSPRHHRLH